MSVAAGRDWTAIYRHLVQKYR